MDTRRRKSVPYESTPNTNVRSKYSSILHIRLMNEQHVSDLGLSNIIGVNEKHTTDRKMKVGDLQPKQPVNNEVGKYITSTTCIAKSGHSCKPCHFKFHLPNFLKFHLPHLHHHHHHHSKKDHKDARQPDSLEGPITSLLVPNNGATWENNSITGIDNETFDLTENTSTPSRGDKTLLKTSAIFTNESGLNKENLFNLGEANDTIRIETKYDSESRMVLARKKLQRTNEIGENVAMASVGIQTGNEIIEARATCDVANKIKNYSVAQRRQIFGNNGFGQELMTDRMHFHQKGLLEHWMWHKLSLCEEEEETCVGKLNKDDFLQHYKHLETNKTLSK